MRPGAETTVGRAIRLVHARPERVITSVGIAFALAFAASLVLLPKSSGRIVMGDAVHYFVYLRSLVFDGDIRFQNDYMGLYGLSGPGAPGTEWVFTRLPTGYVRNMMPIGSAIVWAPLFLVTGALAWILSLFGIGGPIDGFARPFQASAAFSGIAAATLGAWFSFRLARGLFTTQDAIWATLAVWFGSSALYYSLVSPTYSHASSMLATSALLYVWWRTLGRQTAGRYAAVGALVGCAALVRVQDAIFLIAPFLDAAADLTHGSGGARARTARAVRNAAAAAGMAALVFSPQMLVWFVIFGEPLLVPQGSGFMRWSQPHVIDVLFSSFRGLFTWTPIVALSVVGLFRWREAHRHVAVTLVTIFVVSCYVNAAVADWWAGEAFGARRFVSCFPIFVVGAAALLNRWRSRPIVSGAVIAALVVCNLLLLFQYQVFLKGWRGVAPYPDTIWNLWVERFIVPFRFLAWARHGN